MRRVISPAMVENTARCSVYQMDSYRYWQRELKRSEFTFGQFGENLQSRVWLTNEVCVGDRYQIGTALFEVTHGIASAYMDTQIRLGDMLEVSEPRGAFTLEAGDLPVVLLSAGVGVTPVMAMLHVLAEQRSVRPIWWIFAARNRRDHPFAQEARELIARLPNARSFVQYSRPDPSDRSGLDFDASGRLTANIVQDLGIPLESEFYLCGPAAFLADFTAGLAAKGVPNDRIHTELFGSGKSIMPGIAQTPGRPPHAPAGPLGNGPTISFARAGLTVKWSSGFENLLEFAEACDVPVRWSCRTGVCHTCEYGLVSGSVKYDPEPLDAPAVGNLLLCCSRPQEDTAEEVSAQRSDGNMKVWSDFIGSSRLATAGLSPALPITSPRRTNSAPG